MTHAYAGAALPKQHQRPVSPHRPPHQQTTPRKRRRIDPAVWITICAFVVLAAALGQVAQRAQLAALTYELHQEQLRLVQAERVRNHLLVEIERSRSLGDIEADARGRLGLVDPSTVAWLTVDGEASEGPAAISADEHGGFSFMSAATQWFQQVRIELGVVR